VVKDARKGILSASTEETTPVIFEMKNHVKLEQLFSGKREVTYDSSKKRGEVTFSNEASRGQ